MENAFEKACRNLLVQAPHGIALCETVWDGETASDFYFLAANPSFSHLFSLSDSFQVHEPASRTIGKENPLFAGILETLGRATDSEDIHVASDDGGVRELQRIGLGDGQFALVCAIPEPNGRQGEMNHILATQKLEAISRLAGGIAHDFNNILGAISGYASMIEHKFAQDNKKLGRYAGMINSASRRAAELITKLLMFSRRSSFEPAPIRMHALIDEVCDDLRNTLDSSIHLIRRFRANRPVILGDGAQLRNVLSNLIVNAREAMQDGGELLIETHDLIVDQSKSSALAAYLQPGPYTALSVIDNGVGMSPEVQLRMFEPFFTTKDAGSGAGLGLASVYGAVKAHHGHIEVESSPHNGARFTVYFAALTDAEDDAVTNAEITPGEGCIVLIDDEQYMLEMEAELLEGLGYSTTVFSNGSQALDFLREHADQTDLVILDMIMPGMNGTECLERLREFAPDCKVLIASGFIDENEAARVFELGAIDILRKPFSLEAISRRLADTLGR